MQTFQFKGKKFDFPIKVYTSFQNYDNFWYLLIFAISLHIFVFTQFSKKTYALVDYLCLILPYTYFLLIKKPIMLLYADKFVFTAYGLIKPKSINWQDCNFATQHKKGLNGKNTIILSLKNKNDVICNINLNLTQFNEHKFNIQDSLQFFETMSAPRVKNETIS